MSRTQHTRKPDAAKREAVRKVHPYHDATADWLRENPAALEELRAQQAEKTADMRMLHAQYATRWLTYCEKKNAPAAVISQAKVNVKKGV